MKNKKAMSQIVTSVIMIVLVLIGVGIIWTIVGSMLDRGKEQIALGSDCLEIDLKITKANCDESGNCNVTINRKSGGNEIGGVRLIFTDESNENSYPHTIQGNIVPLATKTEKNIATGITDIAKIELIVYFLNEAEEELLCKETTQFDF